MKTGRKTRLSVPCSTAPPYTGQMWCANEFSRLFQAPGRASPPSSARVCSRAPENLSSLRTCTCVLLAWGHFQLTYDLEGRKSRYGIARRRPSALPIPGTAQLAPGASRLCPSGQLPIPTMHFTWARSSNHHRLQRKHINICT